MANRPGGQLAIREMAQGVYVDTMRSCTRVTFYLSAFNTQSYDFQDAAEAERHAQEIAAHYRIPVIR